MQSDYHELEDVYKDDLSPAKKLLFSGADAFISKLRAVKVVAQDAPCTHPAEGDEKLEGAAFPEINSICLSVDEIEKRKHSNSDIWEEVTGLLAHEMFHIINPTQTYENHVLARNFQIHVGRSLPDATKFLFDYMDTKASATAKLQSARETLNSNKTRLDLPSLCSDVVKLATDTDLTFERIEKHTFKVKNFRMKTLSQALKLRFFNMA